MTTTCLHADTPKCVYCYSDGAIVVSIPGTNQVWHVCSQHEADAHEAADIIRSIEADERFELA